MFRILYLSEGFYIGVLHNPTFTSKTSAKRFLKRVCKKHFNYWFYNADCTDDCSIPPKLFWHSFKNYRIEEFDIRKVKED